MTEILQCDLTELVHAETMRLVLEPEALPAGVPEPGDDFAGCVDALLERAEAAVYSLPRVERPAYFLERAREMLRWCRKVKAPEVLRLRAELWLARLERGSAAGTPKS